VLKEAVGCQDQTFAAFGGFNLIRFGPGSSISVEPIHLSELTMEELSASLIMFFTGITRRAASIEADKIKNINSLNTNLQSMLRIVDEAYDLLVAGKPLSDFGTLLNRGWMEKKSLAAGVTSSVIDEIYSTAMQNGALGGKLLGAGGGGFMLFFVPPEKREQLKKALSHLSEIPFKMDAPGSSIIHV
jgi:D-glycero-alpha-D-manno-heptose-7-phosphate kinase